MARYMIGLVGEARELFGSTGQIGGVKDLDSKIMAGDWPGKFRGGWSFKWELVVG